MKGLTLIETVVYIALFSILMTGALTASFDLLESGQKSLGKATVQEEGSFVQRKMDWALGDMSVAPTVSGSSCTQSISVSKTGYASNPVVFQINTTNKTVEIKENGGSAVALTTSNVSATCLKFTANPAECGLQGGVTATISLSGLDFVTTKCLRK